MIDWINVWKVGSDSLDGFLIFSYEDKQHIGIY
jgi:hypothetical protein